MASEAEVAAVADEAMVERFVEAIGNRFDQIGPLTALMIARMAEAAFGEEG